MSSEEVIRRSHQMKTAIEVSSRSPQMKTAEELRGGHQRKTSKKGIITGIIRGSHIGKSSDIESNGVQQWK